MTHFQLPLSLVAAVLAALLSAVLILITRPLLLRHAMASPNARSSHRIPTPQGAGIAVIAATLLVAGAIIASAGTIDPRILGAVFGASLFIAIVGFADDLKSLPVPLRLTLQALAIGAILFTTSGTLR